MANVFQNIAKAATNVGQSIASTVQKTASNVGQTYTNVDKSLGGYLPGGAPVAKKTTSTTAPASSTETKVMVPRYEAGRTISITPSGTTTITTPTTTTVYKSGGGGSQVLVSQTPTIPTSTSSLPTSVDNRITAQLTSATPAQAAIARNAPVTQTATMTPQLQRALQQANIQTQQQAAQRATVILPQAAIEAQAYKAKVGSAYERLKAEQPISYDWGLLQGGGFINPSEELVLSRVYSSVPVIKKELLAHELGHKVDYKIGGYGGDYSRFVKPASELGIIDKTQDMNYIITGADVGLEHYARAFRRYIQNPVAFKAKYPDVAKEFETSLYSPELYLPPKAGTGPSEIAIQNGRMLAGANSQLQILSTQKTSIITPTTTAPGTVKALMPFAGIGTLITNKNIGKELGAGFQSFRTEVVTPGIQSTIRFGNEVIFPELQRQGKNINERIIQPVFTFGKEVNKNVLQPIGKELVENYPTTPFNVSDINIFNLPKRAETNKSYLKLFNEGIASADKFGKEVITPIIDYQVQKVKREVAPLLFGLGITKEVVVPKIVSGVTKVAEPIINYEVQKFKRETAPLVFGLSEGYKGAVTYAGTHQSPTEWLSGKLAGQKTPAIGAKLEGVTVTSTKPFSVTFQTKEGTSEITPLRIAGGVGADTESGVNVAVRTLGIGESSLEKEALSGQTRKELGSYESRLSKVYGGKPIVGLNIPGPSQLTGLADVYVGQVKARIEEKEIKKAIPIYTKAIQESNKITGKQEGVIADINKLDLPKKEKEVKLTADKLNSLAQQSEDLNSRLTAGQITPGEYSTKFKTISKEYDILTPTYENQIKGLKADYNKAQVLQTNFDNLETQKQTIMNVPEAKTITNILEKKGGLGTLEQDFMATKPSTLAQLGHFGLSYGAEYASYSIPYVGQIRAAGLLGGGVSDVSEKNYLEGGMKIGGGALVLVGPGLLKGTLGKGSVSAIPSTSGKIFSTVGKVGGVGLVGGLGAIEGYGTYQRTGSLAAGIGAGTGTLFGLIGPSIYEREMSPVQTRTQIEAPKRTLKGAEQPFSRTLIPSEQESLKLRKAEGVIGYGLGAKVVREQVSPGSIAPVYRQWQVDVRSVLGKTGVEYAPTPLYVGTPYGAKITTGLKGDVSLFGKELYKFDTQKITDVTRAEALEQYQTAFNLLRSRGLSIAKAKSALKYTSPKDIIYATTLTGEFVGGPNIREFTYTGESRALKVKQPATFINPLTGKVETLKTTGVLVSPMTAEEFVKAREPGQNILGFLESGFQVPKYSFGAARPIVSKIGVATGGQEALSRLYGPTPESREAIGLLKERVNKGFGKEFYYEYTVEAPRKGTFKERIGFQELSKKSEKVFGIDIAPRQVSESEVIAAERYRGLGPSGRVEELTVQRAGYGLKEPRYAVRPEDIESLPFTQTTLEAKQISATRRLTSKGISPTAQLEPIRSIQEIDKPFGTIKVYGPEYTPGAKGYTVIKGVKSAEGIEKATYVLSPGGRPTGGLTLEGGGLGADLTGYTLKQLGVSERIPFGAEPSRVIQELKGVPFAEGLKTLKINIPGEGVKTARIGYDKYGTAKSISYGNTKISLDKVESKAMKPFPLSEADITLDTLKSLKSTKQLGNSLAKLSPSTRDFYINQIKETYAQTQKIPTTLKSLKAETVKGIFEDVRGTTSLIPQTFAPTPSQVPALTTSPKVVSKTTTSLTELKNILAKEPSTKVSTPTSVKVELPTVVPVPSMELAKTELGTYAALKLPSTNLKVPYVLPSLIPKGISTPSTSISPTLEPLSTPAIQPILTPTSVPETVVQPIMTPTAQPIVEPIVTPIVTPIVQPIIQPIATITPGTTTITGTPTYVPFGFTPIILPRKKVIKRKVVKGRKTGYEVFVKRKGKYQPISFPYSLPESEAMAIGARRVLGTAGATFKVVPSFKPIRTTGARVSPQMIQTFFRAPKSREAGVFVQRETTRITTPGEKREITRVGIATRVARQASRNRSQFLPRTTSRRGLSLSSSKPTKKNKKIKFI